MAAKVLSCMILGLEGKLVEVEVDILPGLSAFSIVGLGDTAVQEAKERLRSAIKNSGFSYPQQKKIINLAPAHLHKQGPHFDLAMAIGLLAASKQLVLPAARILFSGELALDGTIRPVRGLLSMLLFAQKNGFEKVIIPQANEAEAALVKNLNICAVSTLAEAVAILEGKAAGTKILPKPSPNSFACTETLQSASPFYASERSESTYPDFGEISGQMMAKHALMIAAAGHHHCLLFGPPGVGKTMLAKALPSILPPLEEAEMFEVMQIYSAAGLLIEANRPLTERPFRQVHPTATLPALIGGGFSLKPGEISLAHHGVLFLDEIAEFPRSHLESLRSPLEAKVIHLNRLNQTVQYPAHFLLLAGMNPCPCGYYGDRQKECQCQPSRINAYQKKLSGPLFDRLDLVVEVSRQSPRIYNEKITLTSQAIKKQILKARRLQLDRFSERSPPNSSKLDHTTRNSIGMTNSTMNIRSIKIYCQLDQNSSDFFHEAAEKLSFSGRNYHQILKVARTIADLNGHEKIEFEDLSEALQYRQRFRT